MDGFDQRNVPNALGHSHTAGRELARLSAFYREVFGWSVAPRGPGYASVETPTGSIDGALVESDEAGLTIGIVVPELGRSLDVAWRRAER